MNTSTIKLSLRPAVLLLAGAAGLGLGACQPGDETDNPQIELRCNDYCKQAKLCDDSLNEEKCVDGCTTSVANCMADEQSAALDQIQDCAKESCSDFVGCSIDAGAKCYFGL